MSASAETDRQCTLCAAMQPSVNRSGSESSAVVVYLDDVLIALRDPCQAGLVFAPRSHAGVLSIEPSQTAAFLAAMRRVVLAMQSTYGWTDATIQPSELSGASGHVCYQVIPDVPDAEPPAFLRDEQAQSRLREMLGDGALPRTLRPVT